jgi:hypothetical protein
VGCEGGGATSSAKSGPSASAGIRSRHHTGKGGERLAAPSHGDDPSARGRVTLTRAVTRE